MSVPSTTQTSQVPISKAKPELKRMPGTNNILSQMPRTEKNSLEQIKKSLETRKHEEEQAKLQMRKDQESSSREESPLQFQKPIRPAQHNSSTDAAEEKRQQAREQVRQMLLTESSQRSLQKLPSSTETAEESNGASNPSSSQEHASSPSCGSNASSNTSVGKKRGLGFASLLTSMIFGKPDHNDKNAMQCPKTPDKCVRASPQTSTPISYAISPYVGYAHFPFHCHTHTLTHTHTHAHREHNNISHAEHNNISHTEHNNISHSHLLQKYTCMFGFSPTLVSLVLWMRLLITVYRSDSEDESPSGPPKKIPRWARQEEIQKAVMRQKATNPDAIFGLPERTCDLRSKHNYHWSLVALKW